MSKTVNLLDKDSGNITVQSEHSARYFTTKYPKQFQVVTNKEVKAMVKKFEEEHEPIEDTEKDKSVTKTTK